MKRWKKVVLKKRLALLMAVVLAFSTASGFIVRADNNGAKSPTDVSTEKEKQSILYKTKKWDFENKAQLSDFSLYQSAGSAFTIQNGVLVPNGKDGELKAILNADIEKVKSISVDIIPGASETINGGLYIGASDVGHGVDAIKTTAFLVDSSFSGWADAPKRTDLIFAKFPWQELGRTIIEGGDAFFPNGVKEPLNLKLDFGADIVVATLSLVSNPAKYAQVVYKMDSENFDGLIGLRANGSDTCFDNLEIQYGFKVQTDVWDFSNDSQKADFTTYQSGTSSFDVKNGMLVPSGAVGEMKAILDEEMQELKSVSVDMIPGASGTINGGLYIGASDVGHGVDAIKTTAFIVDSSFSGWADAPKRTDLIFAKFPWQELGRTIIEGGNAFFPNGVKEPLNLKLDFGADIVVATLSLVSNPAKYAQVVYKMDSENFDGLIGFRANGSDTCFDNLKVQYYVPEVIDKTPLQNAVSEAEQLNQDDYTAASWAAFDQALASAKQTLADENATQKMITQAKEALENAKNALVAFGEHGEEVTYTFTDAKEAEDFAFYHSSNGGFAVQDGKLVPAGEVGEFKAVIEKNAREYKSISVDIIPSENGGINAGVYIGASNANHPVDQIDALSIGIESQFTGWDDAANRVDLVVGSFPVWKELSRTISETGNNNALFTNGEKKPLNLKVDIDGAIVTITLSLKENPSTYIQTVYQYTGEGELAAGYVGLRSAFNDSSFDNLYLLYDQYTDKTELKELVAEIEALEQDSYSDKTWNALQDALKTAKNVLSDEKSTQDEVDAAIKALEDAKAGLKLSDTYKKVIYDFEDLKDALDFDFYHSSNDGFAIKDGKLVTSDASGELKAILRGTNRAYKSVSVDIYPDKDGNINSGLYIHAAGFGHAQDKGHALSIGIESNFIGWEDAANRVDIVVGSFPEWKELSRTISETGNGNALFTDGKKEPLNLKVDIEEKEVTITVSLLSNPDVFVQNVYSYTGDGNLTHGRVGIRSINAENSFDNLEAVYKTEVYSEEEILGPITQDMGKDQNNTNIKDKDLNNNSPNTGDSLGMTMTIVMLLMSLGTVLFLFSKKKRNYRYN